MSHCFQLVYTDVMIELIEDTIDKAIVKDESISVSSSKYTDLWSVWNFLFLFDSILHVHYMSCLMTKPTKWLCAQQRLRSAWASTQSDQSSLCTQCVAKDPRFHHADSEDSYQTGRMPKLIWVFAGRTCHCVGFVMRQLTCKSCMIILHRKHQTCYVVWFKPIWN